MNSFSFVNNDKGHSLVKCTLRLIVHGPLTIYLKFTGHNKISTKYNLFTNKQPRSYPTIKKKKKKLKKQTKIILISSQGSNLFEFLLDFLS